MNSKELPQSVIEFMKKLETNKEELEKERIHKTEKEFSCSHGVSIFRVTQLMGPPPKKEIIKTDVNIDPEVVNKLRIGSDTEKPMSDMAIARLFNTSNQKIISICGRRKDVIDPYSRLGRPASECSAYIAERKLNTEKWETPKDGDEYWKGIGELKEHNGPIKTLHEFTTGWSLSRKNN